MRKNQADFTIKKRGILGAVSSNTKPGFCSGCTLQVRQPPAGHKAAVGVSSFPLPSGSPSAFKTFSAKTTTSYFYKMVTSLEKIAAFAAENEHENDAFAEFLKQQNEAPIDEMVFNLNQSIEPAIDCTTCGNCCKTLMINVTEEETIGLSNHLQKSLPEVSEQYLEKGLGDKYIINQMPCHFLEGTKCSIYNHRFAGCREFPALNQPNFTQRLFTVFMHYGRCPIIYNVVEALKTKTGFKAPSAP